MYLRICVSGFQKDHQKKEKETEDTILKKLILRVLMRICVSVFSKEITASIKCVNTPLSNKNNVQLLMCRHVW
jgi:hypothetical protein